MVWLVSQKINGTDWKYMFASTGNIGNRRGYHTAFFSLILRLITAECSKSLFTSSLRHYRRFHFNSSFWYVSLSFLLLLLLLFVFRLVFLVVSTAAAALSNALNHIEPTIKIRLIIRCLGTCRLITDDMWLTIDGASAAWNFYVTALERFSFNFPAQSEPPKKLIVQPEYWIGVIGILNDV